MNVKILIHSGIVGREHLRPERHAGESTAPRLLVELMLENFQICPCYFLDLSGEIFRFVRKNFLICQGKFSDLSGRILRFVRDIFWICWGKFSDL